MTDFQIKPDKVEQFKQFVSENCLDPYSFGVVRAVVKVMTALDQGKTVKDSPDEMYGEGLTGFMAGCAANVVSDVHIRGEEFKDFWNLQFGITPEQAKGGVVNPAIMTVKT